MISDIVLIPDTTDLWQRPFTHDIHIFNQLWVQDEYRMRGRTLENSMVFDIGAHAGYFSRLAFMKGAGKVIAFEPHFDNYEVAKVNLRKYIEGGRCILLNKAVARSDIKRQKLYYERYEKWNLDANTGGITMEQNPLPEDVPSLSVEAVGLDDIMQEFGVPRLIKIDAEGAEWATLMTSRRLSELPEVLGEYHEVGGNYDHHDASPYNLPYERLSVEEMRDHLLTHGGFDHFDSTRHRYSHYNKVLGKHFDLSWLGHFFAWRNS